jgi:bifunctional oligoribonuclease and PAP phosphatase NrnA
MIPAKYIEGFTTAKEALYKAQRILIMSHRNPDGDSIGANLGLKQALEKTWKKSVTPACVDPIPEDSAFLKGANDYVDEFDPKDFDLFVSVDCGAHYMPAFHEKYPEVFSKKVPFINIDHHASNDFFGTINIVDEDAASTTQVIYHFLKFCKLPIDPDIATALLHGLYFDTGSFMHSNTTPEVLRIASSLLKSGADLRQSVKKQFQTKPISQLKLWGRIFDRIHVTPRGVTRSHLTAKDFEECKSGYGATNGAIDYLNAVPEGRFSTLIAEDGKGRVKGSLRTRDDTVDVAKVAGLLGGGGHKKASGFSIPARLRPEGLAGKLAVDEK